MLSLLFPLVILQVLSAAGESPETTFATAAPRLTTEAAAVPSSSPVRFELPNGLRVWVQEDRRRPVAIVQIIYKVGSVNEGPGTTGLAHYVEHMVYRATKNIPNEDGYRFVDRIGGRWSGGTSPMQTMYRETVPSWALEETLVLTAERMTRSLFDETEFERERSNVVTEANGFSRTTPEAAFRDALMATSFEIHPYRHSSNTWARDNLTVTRDQAHDFYRRYYGPNNAVLAIVGDVSVDEVRRLVTRYFGPLEPAPETGEVRLVEPPSRAEKRLTLTHPEVEKRVEILYRAPQAAHRDYPVLAVLDRVLNSRLDSVVSAAGGRELSTRHEPRPYPFVYRIAVTAEDDVDLDALVDAIQTEIERLGREGIHESDLRTVTEASGHDRDGPGRDPEGDGRPSLQAIVNELIAREVFPWEVGPETLARIERRERDVESADLQAYVDRWLRTSQRTVGFLVPGEDDFMPEWSDGRPLAGERMEVPPLTELPPRRERPSPVPAKALQPLDELPIRTARRELDNGVILRAARRDGGSSALHVRIRLGEFADPPGKEGLTLLALRLLTIDPRSDLADESRAVGVSSNASTDLFNVGYFDIRRTFPAAGSPEMVDVLAQALAEDSVPSERFESERERLLEELLREPSNLPARAIARRRVLEGVAPSWRGSLPGTPESVARITAEDVADHLSELVQGSSIIVSHVGPGDPIVLLDAIAPAFGALRRGAREVTAGSPTMNREGPGPAPARDEHIVLRSETQVDIVAGLPGVPHDHPDRLALQLLNYIVGTPSYGGRLGWALTVGGLTYSSAATTTSGMRAGHVLITTRANTNNAAGTIQAIREVVGQVGEHGVEEWEVREAQSFILGRTLLFGPRDDSDAATLAGALLDSEFPGEQVLDLPAISAAVLAVTVEEVNEVARRYYRPELLKLVAVGALPDTPLVSPFPPGTFRSLFEEQ
jgi:zinc protease